MSAKAISTNESIYTALADMGQPATLPAQWSFLQVPQDHYAPVRDYREALQRLREKFTDGELQDAGVLVEIGEPEESKVIFNLHLCLGSWQVLRCKESGPPYEIVTGGGCLSSRRPAVLAAFDDYRFRRLLKKEDSIYATFSSADALVLQALKIPAMVAAGLDAMRGQDLKQFCTCFDVRHYGDLLDPYSWDENAFEDDDDEEDEDEEEEVEDAGQSSHRQSPPGNSAAKVSPQGLSSKSAPPTVAPPTVAPPTVAPPNVAPPNVAPPKVGPTGRAEQSAPSPKTANAGSDNWSSKWKGKLVIANWRLASVSEQEPGVLPPSRAYLVKLTKELNLIMDQVVLWQPTPEAIRKIRAACKSGVPRIAKNLLVSGCIREEPLVPPEPTTESDSDNPYPYTPEEILQTLNDRGKERAEAVRNIHKRLDVKLFKPMLSDAMSLPPGLAQVQALAEVQVARKSLEFINRSAFLDAGNRLATGELVFGHITAAERAQLDQMVKTFHSLFPKGKK